jgi:magnesium chelatase accessory protein
LLDIDAPALQADALSPSSTGVTVPQSEAETSPNPQPSSFIEAAGLRWHVQQSGSGPKMLLVHGAAASTHSWREIIPVLSQHYSVLAIDLPGHGLTSEIPPMQSSIAGFGNVLTILLGELHFQPSYVVGHSTGAVILCNMALSHQINPRVIVSVNGAFVPLMGMASSLISRLGKRLATRRFLPGVLARRAFKHQNVARVLEATGSHLDPAGVDRYAKLLQQPAHVTSALQMMSHWDLASFVAQLELLTHPLALLVASNDKVVPLQDVFNIMQRVKTANLYPLPGLGHLAHEEQPGLVAERILQICAAYA